MKANILATAALATLLAACSNDSDIFNTPDYADTPIGLNVNVGPMATRAGYDDTNLTESSFGLYLATQDNLTDERYNCTNREVKYEYDNGWTIQGEQLLWKSNSATVSYYAYLPYTGAVSDAANYAFTVEADQSNESNVKASDLLWTGGQTAKAGTALDINFKHALSKLNVTLKKGSELDEGVTFTSVKLSNCATTTTVNLTDGTTGTATNSGQAITMYAATENEQYECILVPQTFARSLKVEITGNNGKVYTFTSNKDLTFASGVQYTLNLTVGRDKVTTDNISAESWGDEQQGGDLVTE